MGSRKLSQWHGFIVPAMVVLTVLVASCQSTPVTLTPSAEDPGPLLATPSMIPVSPTEEILLSPTPEPIPTVPLALEPSEVSYRIPLHVQHKSQDQLVVMFSLDQAHAGRVFWWLEGDTPGRAGSEAFGADQEKHIVRLSGLIPGERYEIAVGLEGVDGFYRLPTFRDEPWGPINIQLLSDPVFPLTIGVFGDSGFGEAVTVRLAERLATLGPDLVFHTGDLVYLAYQEGSSEGAYEEKWYQTLSSLLQSSVIYPVVGNHEYDADAGQDGIPYYFHAFPMLDALEGGWHESTPGNERQWYALELGSIQVLFLNTQLLYGLAGKEAQNQWLESRLGDTHFSSTIVVFHVPPYTSGRHDRDGIPVISNWIPAFEASNVRLVLSGHDHNYERFLHKGITYLVSGGGSSVLYSLQERHEDSQHFDAVTHFVWLEIDAGRIEITAIDVDGNTIDTYMIEATS